MTDPAEPLDQHASADKPRARSRRVFVALAGVVLAGILLMWPVGATDLSLRGLAEVTQPMTDFSTFSDAKPTQPLRVLFIHHSTGGQWLAEPGPDKGESCIYVSHPNGGGLRSALQAQGYTLHEASYGSQIGQSTDLFDWLPKFSTQMDRVLVCRRQDDFMGDGQRNHVVMFKSCFPNSALSAVGAEPGNPAGPELTLANTQATYRALLDCFAQQPETLFVCVTTPPLSARVPAQPLWKVAARTLLGKPSPAQKLETGGQLARELNHWLTSADGWLKDYPHRNVVVFDYRSVLTGGKSDYLLYPTGDGSDSHPSTAGQKQATQAFVPFLNRAVRRAGLVS